MTANHNHRPPPDDSPGPVLTTPKRLADQVHRIAEKLAALHLEFRALGPYFGDGSTDTVPRGLHDIHEAELSNLAARLCDLGAAVRVGEVAVRGAVLDRAAGKGDRPLIDYIERNGAGGVDAGAHLDTGVTPAGVPGRGPNRPDKGRLTHGPVEHSPGCPNGADPPAIKTPPDPAGVDPEAREGRGDDGAPPEWPVVPGSLSPADALSVLRAEPGAYDQVHLGKVGEGTVTARVVLQRRAGIRTVGALLRYLQSGRDLAAVEGMSADLSAGLVVALVRYLRGEPDPLALPARTPRTRKARGAKTARKAPAAAP